MRLRAISKRIRVSYSTVRGWLMRMKDADLERRFGKKHPGQNIQLDERVEHAIRFWLGNPPNLHGFQAGAWSLDIVTEVVKRRLGIEYKERTMRRILNFLGYSYRKPRPIPEKSAAPEEQEKFMRETNELVGDLTKIGCAILGGDEASCQKWSSGGYAWGLRGGCDMVDVSLSKATVKMFGALGKDGHHMQVADALNSDTFIPF